MVTDPDTMDRLASTTDLIKSPISKLPSIPQLLSIPEVLNLWGLAYPQIKAVPLRVPLNKNLTQIVPLNKKIAKTRMGSFR
jgi:hypothetical protein